MLERDRLRTAPAWIVAAGLLAIAIAAGAVLALAPADTGPEPLPVVAEERLDAERLELAREYRPTQRQLAIGALLAQLALLVALALGRPAPAIRRLERLGRHPLAGAAIAAAAISAALALAALPFAVAGHGRAVDYGLSTQSLGEWLGDRGRAAVIGAAMLAVGAAALVSIQRRWPRRWWIPASGLVTAYATAIVWLGPVVIAPIFNDFERLPDGQLRSEVIELAERGGVEVGEVYVTDASRRTTAINAYVDGLGPTKRVVLYDNLVARADMPPLRSVLAHELAHAHHRDLLRGIAYVALVAPAGLLFVALASGAIARRRGWAPATPVGLAALALPLAVAVFGLTVAGNALSREVERAADRFALELTEDPEAFIELQRELAAANLSDPDPPGWARFLFGTHPPLAERIGVADAYRARGRGAGSYIPRRRTRTGTVRSIRTTSFQSDQLAAYK
jgi:STE24 endopeptidase